MAPLTDCVRTAIVYPGVAMLVATEDGRIVGSLLGTFDGWRGNLYRLVVKPSMRRRGVATALVRRWKNSLRNGACSGSMCSSSAIVRGPWPSGLRRVIHGGERIDRHVASLGA